MLIKRKCTLFCALYFILICDAHSTTKSRKLTSRKHMRSRCDNVCIDLPADDKEPVCMIYSRYKKGYQFFVNLCHARRAICRDNLVLHMVHSSRCLKNKQYFMPVN